MMASAPDFPEYAIKVYKGVAESRKRLASELVVALDEIMDALAFDPGRYPERLRPASRDGKSLVYVHPDPELEVTFERDDEGKVLYFFHVSAPTFKVAKSIFISYSHEDTEWLTMIKKFLLVLEQQGLVDFWDDSRIEAGDKWREEIERSLSSASAAVLLVSQSFLASDFVTTVELPKILAAAKEHGTKVFWIPVSPSTVFETHKEIVEYQSLISDPKRSLEELAEAERKREMVRMSQALGQVVS